MEKLNPKERWWYNYRRVKNRPRGHESFETIFRMSLKEILKEYITHGSFANIKYIFEPDVPVKYRVLWFLLLGFAMAFVVFFLRFLWLDTLTKPLIVTMDSSTYPIGKIDFPAIAICNINRISRKAVTVVARDIESLMLSNNKTMEDLEWFVLQAGRLLDFAYNESHKSHRLLNVFGRFRADSQGIIKRMKQLAPSCEEMLIRCVWGGALVNCSSLFKVRRTVRGHCCAFNYVLDYNSAGRPDRSIAEVQRQSIPGSQHGLSIIMDSLLEDYAYTQGRYLVGFDIFMYDPTHFADPSSGGRVIQRLAQPNEIVLFELQSTKQIAAEEVRKYPLTTRKCLFHDERPNHFGLMYSYSACIVQCRIKTIRSLCKCIPYFWPTGKDEGPVCTLDDLQCLNKYKEKLLYLYPMDAATKVGLELELQDSLYCPDCLPDCEFTRHVTKSTTIPLYMTYHPEKTFIRSLTKDMNLTDRCVVSIFQSTSDGTLDRLDVVAYWFEILSNIGGFAGMLVGISIIAVFEIIYFFIVHFIRVLWKNYKKYN